MDIFNKKGELCSAEVIKEGEEHHYRTKRFLFLSITVPKQYQHPNVNKTHIYILQWLHEKQDTDIYGYYSSISDFSKSNMLLH